MKKDYTEKELLEMLESRHPEVIDILFRQHYSYLCNAAYSIVKEASLAEDMAQEVFVDIWKKRAQLEINTAIRPYLKRAVVNKSINYVKRKKVNFSALDTAEVKLETPAKALSSLESSELSKIIKQAIGSLPEKCRIVFTLSRQEEMTYKEIASKLEISTKTVENQISKALRIIRNVVNKY